MSRTIWCSEISNENWSWSCQATQNLPPYFGYPGREHVLGDFVGASWWKNVLAQSPSDCKFQLSKIVSGPCQPPSFQCELGPGPRQHVCYKLLELVQPRQLDVNKNARAQAVYYTTTLYSCCVLSPMQFHWRVLIQIVNGNEKCGRNPIPLSLASDSPGSERKFPQPQIPNEKGPNGNSQTKVPKIKLANEYPKVARSLDDTGAARSPLDCATAWSTVFKPLIND